ncbi:Replication factor C small subunit 2 [Dictyocoela muelleri]|nr:Replication factor C small subunit 2 [Dictyocoela muelleri]
MLWTEKYRPKKPTDFEAPNFIKELINSKEPHLLLYGPPGTGKTTFAHLLGKTSTDKNKLQVYEFNASDDRGINVIRSKIKNLSLTNATIILDECDTLTIDAQHSLRRIVECSKARFVFITNYLSKIITPLRSRLLKIKFELKPESYKRLIMIGKNENMNLDDSEYKKIFEFCNCDLRKSINFLQMANPLIINQNKISNNDLEKFGMVPENVVNDFLNLKNENVDIFVKNFINNSYSVLQFIKQLKIDVADVEGLIYKGCDTEIILHYLCYSRNIRTKF